MTIKDTAKLSGGDDPTGTITFTLYNPNGTLVDTETVNVRGDGSYTTPKGYTLPTTGAVIGTYQWDATYSGDRYNNSASDNNDPSEQVTVGKASPSITTTPNTSGGQCSSSLTLEDKASLTGGDDPTGTITFTLYNPNGTLVDTETVKVRGDGSYSTPNGYTLPTKGEVTGTYQWDATYSGDSNKNPASDVNDKAEQLVVGNQTQSPSYWCGSQGQSLIDCLNGQSSSKDLGNWLASTCPNLFGNLKGCTNSQVASYCKTLSNGNSNQNACAQVLSTALCAYVTDSSLAGNSGQSYGFAVSGNGFGTNNWNVGSNGSAIGLSNNQSCNVLTLLQQVDSQWSSRNGFSSSAVDALNSIFGSINQAGSGSNDGNNGSGWGN